MKKILFGLTLMLLMVGCTDRLWISKENETLVITNYSKNKRDGECMYTLGKLKGIPDRVLINFYDECGKFDVGDTIWFSKEGNDK